MQVVLTTHRYSQTPLRHASAPSRSSDRGSVHLRISSVAILTRAQCLLPLANTPLIEYTFEFLANAGVEVIFVYCGAHREQVEQYIKKSKWAAQSSPFSRLELIQSTSHSIGDAMRDLDSRSLLTGDFLLVYGDVVSNLPLESALAAHRARRVKDKNAIMTMVLREAGANHRTKARGTSPIFVIDPTKDRCLHFEQMPNRDQTHFLSIDPELLSSSQELEIRQDLIDCGIDICTPDVLALWSDNFDFQAPRKGFLHSVLKDYELNGKTFHTHIVSDHYAARVRNLHAYESVSKDIVSRWAYPLCPDSNLVQGQSYRLQKGNIYKEEGVILARDCVIGSKTVIGRGTSIGDKTIIKNSIIGRHCQIGRNVKIDGAYLWDYASVGDGSTISKSVVANEAAIGRRCTVEAGALISYGVTIGEGMTIRGEHRITRAKRRREGSEDVVRGKPDPAVVGPKGDGFEFQDSDEDDEDELVDGLVSTGPRESTSHWSIMVQVANKSSIQLRERIDIDTQLGLRGRQSRLTRRQPFSDKQFPLSGISRQSTRSQLRSRCLSEYLRLARARPRVREHSTRAHSTANEHKRIGPPSSARSR